MKKLLIVVLIVCLCTLVGCSTSKLEGNTKDIMKQIYSNISASKIDSYPLEDEQLNESNCEFWTGMTAEEYAQKVVEGTKRQYSMTAIPEGVVLIQLKDSVDLDKCYASICDNSSLSKFGCLSAEKGIVALSGNYIIMIYGSAETNEYGYSCKEILDSFEKLAGKIDKTYNVK